MKSISEMQEELERELRKEESESNARYEKASRITWQDIAAAVGSVGTTSVLAIVALYFLG
ncbi:hypothetical protein JQR84_24065 (plasmid) [Pseudomonas luteola]|uniref:hypothetical protein n=1 Tax=Pseudomonas TaxID=286 RepID=UPI000EFAA18B|nr:hypothetical protein [Pseudomonas sp. LTJR-52]AYN96932.1 hypothetical protein EAW52_24865 [Pseudomonas sp. LTJR-52]